MRKVGRRYEKKRKVALIIAILLIAFCASVYFIRFYRAKETEYEQFSEPVMVGAELSREVYSIEDGYITGILPETTFRDLKNNLNEADVVVYDKNNNRLLYSQYVGTGMRLEYGGNTYKLVVKGDVTGNGRIGIADLIQMRLALVGARDSFVGEYAKAADITNTGKMTIGDIIKSNLTIVNVIDMLAPTSFVPEVRTTMNTIIVTGETADANSGVKEYWFEIDGGEWVKNENPLENTYTFSGLEKATVHSVRMKVIDNEGNTKITKKVRVRTRSTENEDIDIVLSKEDWTNQNIMALVYYNASVPGAIIEINLNYGVGDWEEYTGPITVSKNTTIYARVINGEGIEIADNYKTITNIDKVSPEEFDITTTVTENSVTITSAAKDAIDASGENGCSGIAGYIIQIFNNDWAKSIEVEKISEVTDEVSYTFDNLEDNTEYTIIVTAKDNAGNTTIQRNGSKIIKTDEATDIGNITIEAIPTGWTNDKVEVTVTYPTEEYIKEISLDGGESWKVYSGTETLTTNTEIRARMKNGTGKVVKEKSLNITNIDKLNPKDFNINVVETTTNSITIAVNTQDANATSEYGKSGIQGYKFKINDVDWTDVKESGIYKFTGLSQGEIYTIRVMAVDQAGNTTEAKNSDEALGGESVPVPSIDDVIDDLGGIRIIPRPDVREFTATEYTKEDVIVEVIYPDAKGYTKEIKIGEADWKTYTGTEVVTKNLVVQARVKDSTGQLGTEESLSITRIDKLAPKDFTMSATMEANTITIKAGTEEEPGTTDAIDASGENGCSGIRGYKYVIIDGLWKWEEVSENTSYTFTNLMQGKTYTIKVIAIDNAGNEKEASTETVTLNSEYTVTFNARGGTVATSSVTQNYGTTITLPTATPPTDHTDYVLEGWYKGTETECPEFVEANKVGNEGDEYEVTENAFLYANWQEPGIYATLYTDGTLAFTATPNKLAEGKTEADVDTRYSENIYNNYYRNLSSIPTSFTPWYNDRNKITSVKFVDKIKPKCTNNWFEGLNNLTEFNQNNLDTSDVFEMSYMFKDCISLTELDLSDFNTGNVSQLPASALRW